MKEKIDSAKIPQHVAIIMDGNGRWAQKKGAMRIFGHKNALAAVRDTIEAADDLGIKIVTLYAFSTENWSRPADEVSALMEIMINSFISELPRMLQNNVRLTAIGDIKSLPKGMQENLANTVEKTKNNTGVRVNLALSYSGRWEIEQAVKQLVNKVVDGQLTLEDVNQEAIASHLNTQDMPDPELLIRTSGELRISNFLLWQMAYTELYFTDVLWPDFRRKDLEEAVLDYQSRERRFGKTGSQIKS
ncbi:isoprenyl transferase [Belliella kenyensis]|uniref:Isoprenyl transferase n=1 Tax=Belliella kenyensis TaxID=1472724 RepID=A0ABV8ERQ8_9BACT|nr:isoprenyl transferase [Belliella kenyensis]MCH7402596.1 isoprenyl transferase [Belliella kenyensis]MDN3603394.1 isoprenyl transferase [Belliella kenyensis]